MSRNIVDTMKRILFIVIITGMMFGFHACVYSQQHDKKAPRMKHQAVVAGQYLITVDESCNAQCIASLISKDYTIKEVKAISNTLFLVVFENDPGLEALVSKYVNISGIKAIQPNYKYSIR